MNKVYLGDSVYAEFTEFDGVKLTTENGGPPSNTIVIEAAVCVNLVQYLKHWRIIA